MADPQNQQASEQLEDDDAPGGSREQDDQQADDGVDPEIRKLRAEAKRLRLERNEFRDKAKTYEDRDKTEQQRAADELAASTRRAEQAEQRLLRYEVASELGISQHASLCNRIRAKHWPPTPTTRERVRNDTPTRSAPELFERPEQRVQRPKTMNDVISPSPPPTLYAIT